MKKVIQKFQIQNMINLKIEILDLEKKYNFLKNKNSPIKKCWI